MILLIIIIALIFILLIINVHCTICYDGEMYIKVKYMFLAYDLINNDRLNSHQKKDQKRNNDKIEGNDDKSHSFYDKISSKFLKSNNLKEFLGIILKITKIIKNRLSKLLKKIKIYKCHMKIDVVSDSAYDVAVKYGKICAVIYPFLSMFDMNSKCDDFYLDIKPLFIESPCNQEEVKYDIRFKIRIIYLICFIICLSMDYVKIKD